MGIRTEYDRGRDDIRTGVKRDGCHPDGHELAAQRGDGLQEHRRMCQRLFHDRRETHSRCHPEDGDVHDRQDPVIGAGGIREAGRIVPVIDERPRFPAHHIIRPLAEGLGGIRRSDK